MLYTFTAAVNKEIHCVFYKNVYLHTRGHNIPANTYTVCAKSRYMSWSSDLRGPHRLQYEARLLLKRIFGERGLSFYNIVYLLDPRYN